MKVQVSYWGKQYIIRKLEAIAYLGGKCTSCGYNKYYGSLEFHHRNPAEKEFQWNQMKKRSLEDIKKELDKCDLLCANCHREAHQIEKLLESIQEWRKEIDNSRIIERKCLCCGKTFKPRQNKIKFCSGICFRRKSERISWPADLSDQVKKFSQRAVAKQLGVSDRAVSKRLKNHYAPII